MLMARRLPFLNGVTAFEAAEELHVTPAAVSRMVRLLDERLGLPPP
jgi:predicted transcriptional regulator